MTVKHFIDIEDISKQDLRHILEESKKRKQVRLQKHKGVLDDDKPLEGMCLALIFARPSTRTRVSFEVGMRQLGGSVLMLTGQEMQLGRGETIADTAKVLSRYVDAIMIRTALPEDVRELADNATIPVINGLTNYSHPCQIMADIMTFEEHKGNIEGKKIAWVGDGNNVCHSWIQAAMKFNFTLHIATPNSLKPESDLIKKALVNGADIQLMQDPLLAVQDADCVITDTWVSMGDEDVMRRQRLLTPYQVNKNLISYAKEDAIFMHCLPAHREDEVTSDVFDSKQSVVFDEAENRLHAQKGVLLWCLT